MSAGVGEQPHLGRVCRSMTRARELVARGVGHHPGVGLVADPQAVLGEQRRRRRRCTSPPSARARPPRRRRRSLGSARAGRRASASRIRLRSSAAALVVKVSPSTWSGRDLPGGHEVDHPGGHQGGLARAGAGDHDGGLERRADRLPLLRADLEVGVHHPAQVGRRADRRRVESTRPSRQHRPGPWIGQDRALEVAARAVARRGGPGSPRRATGGAASRRAAGRSAVSRRRPAAGLPLRPARACRRGRPGAAATSSAPPARPVACDLVDGAVVDGELVEAELRVLGDCRPVGAYLPVLRSTTTTRPSASSSSRSA